MGNVRLVSGGKWWVNTRIVTDACYVIEADTAEEAQALFEAKPSSYRTSRDTLEEREDVESVERVTAPQ